MMESNLQKYKQDNTGSKKTSFEDLSRDELIVKCKGLFTIAQKCKLSKSELQSEIESYKIQLEKHETEKNNYIDNINTLQELVDSLTEQKLNYITEIDSAQNKIKLIEEKCYTYSDENQKLKSEITAKDNIVADVYLKMSELDSEITSLKRQNKRVVEDNDHLINQLTDLESKIAQFNVLGLEQSQQLRILEEKVVGDKPSETVITDLTTKVRELEKKLQLETASVKNDETQIEELRQLYESEQIKKEKAEIKLRSYKDKIFKCVSCINQLKNSRHILLKTVKDYSESIPKWQNDIIHTSKVLDSQIRELNSENILLKSKLIQLENEIGNKQKSEPTNIIADSNVQLSNSQDENKTLTNKLSDLTKQINVITNDNNSLTNNLKSLKLEYDHMSENHKQEKQLLTRQLDELKLKLHDMLLDKNELNLTIDNLKTELNNSLQDKSQTIENSHVYSIQIKTLEATKTTLETENQLLTEQINDLRGKVNNLHDNHLLESNSQSIDKAETLLQQIQSLETENLTLLKDKQFIKDNLTDVQNEYKVLSQQINDMNRANKELQSQIDSLWQEKIALEENYKQVQIEENATLKTKVITLQNQYDLLKKEQEDLIDLNGLLREEVETLKLSLEQPKEDADNLSDLNVSLQADLVKLETKLLAYKQENCSLLTEVKESRSKLKEFDSFMAEYENVKLKLVSYKTENAELLSEMKEINQVLKERGESISKLQKAIDEMEVLVDSLEKDRDVLKQEKEELIKRTEMLENDIRIATQASVEKEELIQQFTNQKDIVTQSYQQKDNLILTLKEEIEKYKQQQAVCELPNDDMSTSTISKPEEHARMKDLDETFEEKYTKLRIFALKLKKKLNETTVELKQAERDKAKLEKLLNEIDRVPNKTENVESIINKTEDKSEAGVDPILLAQAEAVQKLSTELEQTKVDLDKKTELLAAEINTHKTTKDKLEKALRDAKKKNVLSLEMEDYEKSLKELTAKMEDSKKKMVQMESTIDTQEGTMTAMKTQIKLLEEQIKSEEYQQRVTKEELQRVVEEGKEKDNVIQIKKGIILKLEQDLESEKRKNEDSILEITTLLSDKENVIVALGTEKTELNNKVKKLEFKVSELNEKLKIINIELEDLKTEYSSYKVRAQAVLRQNQTVDHSQEEQLKEETAALRSHIESLNSKLSTVQEQYTEQNTEMEANRRRIAEASSEVSRAQQRTARLHADLTRITQQLESERTQNKLQVTTLTHCYKTQIADLEAKHEKEIEELKKQLMVLQDLGRPGKSNRNLDDMNRNTQYMMPIPQKYDGSDDEMAINVSMIPREEGEGSEAAPSPPPSKSFNTTAGSSRSPVPLDRLLEEGVPEDDSLDNTSISFTPEQEIIDLRRKLQTHQQRVKHLTLLLAESEREGARMAQLSELLKSELRRVHGTSPNTHNTEYMKNVTLKFLTLPPGDERSRLVPVLQKILTLSNDETHKIQAIAKGMDPNPNKGWGSYLPWPGGK